MFPLIVKHVCLNYLEFDLEGDLVGGGTVRAFNPANLS